MGNTGIRYGQGLRPLNVLAPVDIVATATPTRFVKLDKAHWLTFLILFGVITGDSLDVTVEASTTGIDSDTETAIAFQYRKSDIVNTDALGEVTTATASGVAMSASDDGKMLIIDVDPSAVQAALDGAKWVRVMITPGSSSVSAANVAAAAVIEPRYPSNFELSSS